MQNSAAITELTNDVRIGLYPEREDADGKTRKSIVKVDLSIRTNDTKEQVLIALEQMYKKMIEHVNTNYDAFVVDEDAL